jgi:putative Mg2+ transporter-C (MgtC) family protein
MFVNDIYNVTCGGVSELLPYIERIIQLAAALAAGSLIGVTRERIQKPAGLRTHSLICIGAAFITQLSIHAFAGPGGGDPGRVAAQIVSGIGFLGAGTILKKGFSVKGLTTAATLWVTAAVGMGFGSSEYFLAGSLTAFVLLIVLLLKRIDFLQAKSREKQLIIEARNDLEILSNISQQLKDKKIAVQSIEIETDLDEATIYVDFPVSQLKNVQSILADFLKLPGIHSVDIV